MATALGVVYLLVWIHLSTGNSSAGTNSTALQASPTPSLSSSSNSSSPSLSPLMSSSLVAASSSFTIPSTRLVVDNITVSPTLGSGSVTVNATSEGMIAVSSTHAMLESSSGFSYATSFISPTPAATSTPSLLNSTFPSDIVTSTESYMYVTDMMLASSDYISGVSSASGLSNDSGEVSLPTSAAPSSMVPTQGTNSTLQMMSSSMIDDQSRLSLQTTPTSVVPTPMPSSGLEPSATVMVSTGFSNASTLATPTVSGLGASQMQTSASLVTPTPTPTILATKSTKEVASSSVSQQPGNNTLTPSLNMTLSPSLGPDEELVTSYVDVTASEVFFPNENATEFSYEVETLTILPTVPAVPENASSDAVRLSTMISSTLLPTSTADFLWPNASTGPGPTGQSYYETSTAPVVSVSVQCTMVLIGDCSKVMADKETFETFFSNEISSLISMNPSRLIVKNVKCGSVVVDFTLEDTPEADFSEDLFGIMDTQGITMEFNGENLETDYVVFHNGPYAATSSPPPGAGQPSGNPPVVDDGGGEGDGLSFKQQQKLIYILIGVAVGFVVFLAILLVVHHVLRKTCSKTSRSFDLQEEPCIKLTDFNMAHTCIPRPRSIYSSSGADGKFYRYDNGEDVGNPPGSPTSFIYANSDEIKEHYHEVVDPEVHQSTSEDTQISRDFGRSGLPDWNLPLIDGAHAMTEPDLLTSVDSHYSSQQSPSPSDTFRPPSTSSSTLNSRPVFSPPAPPPPPPPPLPTPVLPSGTLQSRHSGDASSEMTDSSGDTNTLTKGSSDLGASMMGIDNPLMTPEEDYDDLEPSTSNRMSRYVIR